ncbi:MAG: iron-siderophore transport system permease protein [Subtercola sp.]|nr:iron-siderophore transport system permease protein [Subtercola sp.]
MVTTLPTAHTEKSPRGAVAATSSRRTVILLALLLLLLLLAGLSLFVGSGNLAPEAVWKALTEGGSDTTALLVNNFRVPRMLLALLVGTELGLGGALMQAITRNPLADPGLLGVNAGAYIAVVLAITYAGVAGISNYVWWSFAGAIIVTAGVYAIGGRGRAGADPARLVLVGVSVSYLLNGISIGITLQNPDTFDAIRFWSAGSLQGRQWDIVGGVLPFILVGAVVALSLGRSLNASVLGDDLARSLGANLLRTRLIGFAAVTILCGAATAAAGPISFLGLMAAFVARRIVGPDQRWILPFAAVIAPIIFLTADMIGRLLIASEVPVGLVTAFVGAPLLIVLMRGRKAVKGL